MNSVRGKISLTGKGIKLDQVLEAWEDHLGGMQKSSTAFKFLDKGHVSRSNQQHLQSGLKIFRDNFVYVRDGIRENLQSVLYQLIMNDRIQREDETRGMNHWYNHVARCS